MQKGIKSIVTLFGCLTLIGVSFKEAFEDDGKISGMEIPIVLFETGKQVPKIAKVSKEALAEAKDLTVPELVEVVKEVKDSPEFKDLDTPTVSAFIELGFRQLQIWEDAKALVKGEIPEKLLQGNVANALQFLQNQVA